jgi:hypothetical protein
MAVPVWVLLGSTVLAPSYAGLAPGFAGVSQVSFAIPANWAAGVYSLSIVAGSVSSQPVNLNVGSPATTLSNARLGGTRSAAAQLAAELTGRRSR